MKVDVVARSGDLSRRAAGVVAEQLRRAVARRGLATAAFSGGSTPAAMLAALARLDVPWPRVHVFQADERAVPDSHPDRNLGLLRTWLLTRGSLPVANLHPMPVADADLDAAAARYAATLREVCGDPAVLDVVHLGLGADGHTASLVPGDPVLEVADRDVAATGVYGGHRRLTLTYPALDRARCRVWLVAGADKAPALGRLVEGDRDVPAGRVARTNAVVLTDVTPATQRAG